MTELRILKPGMPILLEPSVDDPTPTFYDFTDEDGERYGQVEWRRFLRDSPAICARCQVRHPIEEVTVYCSKDDATEVYEGTDECPYDMAGMAQWRAARWHAPRDERSDTVLHFTTTETHDAQ